MHANGIIERLSVGRKHVIGNNARYGEGYLSTCSCDSCTRRKDGGLNSITVEVGSTTRKDSLVVLMCVMLGMVARLGK